MMTNATTTNGTDERTIVRIPAQELRAGDQYLAAGGQLREIIKVWRSKAAHLFAGSRARVETVQAHVVGGTTPKGWHLDEMLTVARLVDQDADGRPDNPEED